MIFTHLLCAVLAAEPQPTPPPAAPSPFFASVDRGIGVAIGDTFGLSLHLATQVRVEETITDGRATTDFRVVIARPALQGYLLRRWIQYFVQAELVQSPSLLDLELIVQPWRYFGIRAGQFRTPFSREFFVPPFMLLFSEFAPSNVFFRDNRDIGVAAQGTVGRSHFEYYTGLFSGVTLNQPATGFHLKWIGRVAYNVIGGPTYDEVPQFLSPRPVLSFGLSGSFGSRERAPQMGIMPTPPPQTEEVGKVGADFIAAAGPVVASGEAYGQVTKVEGGANTWAVGGFTQAGVFLWRRYLQLAGRGDVIAPNATSSAGLRAQGAGQLTWYAREHHLQLELRYAYTLTRATVTVPEARSHAIALQAQLQF
jgi:hypothetical protein